MWQLQYTCQRIKRRRCYQIQRLARVHEPGAAYYGVHSRAWQYVGLNYHSAPPHVSTLLSDHAVLAKQVIYWKLKSVDMDHFVDEIGTSSLCQNLPEDVDTLVNC